MMFTVILSSVVGSAYRPHPDTLVPDGGVSQALSLV